MQSNHFYLLSLVFGVAFLFANQLECSIAASIKAKEPSSPEITDAWVIPKQRRGRERRGIVFPADDSSDEYLFSDEDYDNWVSNKVRELWNGKLNVPKAVRTTLKPEVFPDETTTRKNWYPNLPIAWGRRLAIPKT